MILIGTQQSVTAGLALIESGPLEGPRVMGETHTIADPIARGLASRSSSRPIGLAGTDRLCRSA
jgi:hypothetical protein